jgi:hypothetical protein
LAKKKTSKRGKKTCPNCGALNAARQKVCTKCEKPFPVKAVASSNGSAKPKKTGRKARRNVMALSDAKRRFKTASEMFSKIDAGLALVQRAGSLDEAYQVLQTIERIRGSE